MSGNLTLMLPNIPFVEEKSKTYNNVKKLVEAQVRHCNENIYLNAELKFMTEIEISRFLVNSY